MSGGSLLAFGEVMLRLSPPRGELLLQSPMLNVCIAGAEANVAGQLAALGHSAAIVTRLPDDDLGRAAYSALRGRGIDVSRVVFGGNRIGLYYATLGASVRGTEVLYDRENSAFATASPESWDWDHLLEGVDRLHLSGITPALGPLSAEATVAASKAAADRGIAVSFDGNWRGRLWSRWNGDARSILDRIVCNVDLLFGDHRDIGLLLNGGSPPSAPSDDFEAAAAAAFDAYPNLKMVAATSRRVFSADHHSLRANLCTRREAVRTEYVDVPGIVDRIGTGDAFVAGIISGILSGFSARDIAETGLALGVLAHSVAGDGSQFHPGQVQSFRDGKRDVQR
ncbi:MULTISPECIES: sugar kinase [unclassified Sphingomonas]|uniref:sugar kinase n=1 Tax=unclassified Sphingomonas TaxID=196159 RepID=UPI0006FC2BB8|nr:MULTISPECIES: sugar kinase [unclassified Sphingomonas]KQM28130.1 2-keto-3-deoxygluconate kinase [Sphingomonas sp. Leaf9]KQM44472.1 2-keto-3-deoxygluconate kinase [Sphingomonas sp. Leaf11]